MFGLSFWKALEIVWSLPGRIEDTSAWFAWFAWIAKVNLYDWIYPIGMLAGVAIATSEWWWPRIVKHVRKEGKQQPTKKQTSDQKAYTRRTTREIFEEFKNRTDMQAALLVQSYVGKWVKVNDVVRNVSDDTSRISVIVGKRLTPPVVLVFDKSQWQPFLETLAVGDRIKAEGQVEKVERMAIYLCDCRILPETSAKGGFSGSAVMLKRSSRPPSSGKSDV